MKDLRSLTIEELQEEMKALGQPAFRAVQIFDWLHGKKVSGPDAMRNLPLSLRETLRQSYDCTYLRMELRLISKEDGTRKYVFELQDGNVIESVLMKYDYGNTVCISSQVGCRMGCRFCASTLDGLARDLLPGEMLEQIYRIEEDLGEKVSHIVVMGTGEPLDNLENLLRFLDLITHPKGKNLSERNITVSTCGLVPQIRKLAQEKRQITLALSLHAARDELRQSMMPVAHRYSVAETVAACDEYFSLTGRRMSYEYSLVKGVNDGDSDAEDLSALLKGKNCHVNLIPVNPIRERDYQTPDREHAVRFQKILEKNGINATIRRKMGADIESACGQLRRRFKTQE
ncbi:MAG: 23S rRNA (adenine(2503)-C(2))-methyltransferase RlmN [Lachnospiraceae bacterium]|nr:23S rRNA (adenine(2503)-C(2))-methyltransferase RlmN [Lachnospiraceae bacterium]